MKEKEHEMLRRMAAYCSSAERCKRDVMRKLEAAGLPWEASTRIIARLEDEKFIDEARFAHSFVGDKIRFNSWGRLKIAYELKIRNIPADISREALAEINEEDYHTILLRLLETKRLTLKNCDTRVVCDKLMRFAVSRGFEMHDAGVCLKQLLKGI